MIWGLICEKEGLVTLEVDLISEIEDHLVAEEVSNEDDYQT